MTLVIGAPKGVHGSYIRQSSVYPEQMEWLLHRQHKLVPYKINKVTNEIFCRNINNMNNINYFNK